MKKILFLTALILATATAAFAQQYNLKLNIQPNLRVPLRMNTSATSEFNLPGMGMQKMVQLTKVEVAFYVKEKKGENYIIHGIVNEFAMSVEQMGQKIEVKGTDSIENTYNKPLRAITGKTFVAEITPRFELVGEVKPLGDDMTPENAAAAFAHLRSFFEGLYPEKNIAKGDSWENTNERGSAVFTLTDVTDNSYIIDSKVKLDSEEQGVHMKGEGTQSIEVNRQMGIPIYGLLTLPSSGTGNFGGTAITITTNVVSSFELIQ